MRNDYILDLVESLAKNFSKTVLYVEEDPEPITIENLSDKDMLVIVLKKLLAEGKYNEAENTLFDFIENRECEDIKSVGEWFYNQLKAKSNEDLLEKGFSREEVSLGLNDFVNMLND